MTAQTSSQSAKLPKDFIGRVIEYQAADGSWVVFSPIITATIPRYGSVVQLQVHKLFWEAILDYRSGYRKLDVKKSHRTEISLCHPFL